MSSDWRRVSFDTLIQKGILQIGDGYRAKNEELGGSGLIFLRSAHVRDSHVDFDGAERFRKGDESKLHQKISFPGDVMVTTKGNSTGRTGYVTEHMPTFVYSPHLSFWRSLDQKELVPGYLRAWSNGHEFKEQLKSMCHSTDMAPYLSLSDQRRLVISLPPWNEQDSIAKLNEAVENRITLLRETNATLEAIAQALFKSWFVDFDPVRAKMEGRAPEGMDEATAALFPDSFEESELGLVPRGWRVSNLADLTNGHGGTIQTGPFGSQLHASDYVDSGIPVVMPKDIQNRRVTTDSIARIRPSDADRLARHKLNAGDIVFSRRGDVERHALIGSREIGWLCGTGCLLVRPGDAWPSPTFLSMVLDSPGSRTWLVQHAVGATMPNLNTGILGSVPVVLPSIQLLRAFEDVIAATEAQRSHNASTAETLATLRDTLLPRLISGQLRLPEAAAMIEEAA